MSQKIELKRKYVLVGSNGVVLYDRYYTRAEAVAVATNFAANSDPEANHEHYRLPLQIGVITISGSDVFDKPKAKPKKK